MILFVILSLFVFGLLFGSFSSVIIDRLKSGKKGIMTGRSECPHCKHILSSVDLFPLFSWLFLLGKCRYCRAKISPIYPLLELSMGALFALGGYFFVDISAILGGSLVELARLFFILGISFVTVIFTFYDIRFTEIPDEILVPAIFLVTILL
jgi:prepilin signal peptidase PulO-like enzyme (type II secretory pathway)